MTVIIAFDRPNLAPNICMTTSNGEVVISP